MKILVIIFLRYVVVTSIAMQNVSFKFNTEINKTNFNSCTNSYCSGVSHDFFWESQTDIVDC
jgi:hypothetical protein